jgi:hypothetical protein
MTTENDGRDCHGPCDARSPWLSEQTSPRRDANVRRDSYLERSPHGNTTEESVRAETGATPCRGDTSALTVSVYPVRSLLSRP